MVALVGALATGMVLRVGAWLYNRPLWLDEAMLALGIVGRPLRDVVTGRLPYGQLAPPGFLALQWAAVSAFGGGERALRLLPLLAGLAVLPLVVLLARRVLVEPTLVAVAAWLAAVDQPLVYYSTEAKPYAVDVAIALMLTLAVLAATRRGRAAAMGVGALGAIAVWFSFPAVFVLAGLSIVWAARDPRRASPAVLAWALSAATMVWVASSHLTPADRAYLAGFWADGFSIAAPIRAFGLPLLALAAAGLVLSRPLNRSWVLLLAPVAVTQVAALTGTYPMASRLVVFLVPAVLIAVAGIARSPWGLVVAAVVVAVEGVESMQPTGREDVRSIARAISARWQPGDAVYVYYGAAPTYAYYGIVDSNVVIGGCHRSEWQAYLRELDTLRGRSRVWLVVAHAFDRAGIREDSLLVRYLDANGTRRTVAKANGAFTILYDLSEPVPVGALADRFEPPRATHAAIAGLVCGGV